MGASNLHYHDWESHFAVADEAVAFGTAGVAPLTWPVTGVPTVRIEPNFLDSGATGRGRAERFQDEYALSNIDAGAAWEMKSGNVFWYHLLKSLLQQKPTGIETPGASGFFKHEFTVYTGQPSANFGLSVWHALKAGGTNEAKRALGNVVKSFGITSATNGDVRLAVDTMALTGALATLATPGGTWTNALQHMHRHLITAKIDGAAIAPIPGSFNFTALNNPVAAFGGSQTPQEIVLGQFNITGQMQLTAKTLGMAQFTKFLNRTNARLTFGWGTVVDQTGYCQVDFDATYNAHGPVSLGGIQGNQVGFTSAIAESSPTTTKFTVWHSSNLGV